MYTNIQIETNLYENKANSNLIQSLVKINRQYNENQFGSLKIDEKIKELINIIYKLGNHINEVKSVLNIKI